MNKFAFLFFSMAIMSPHIVSGVHRHPDCVPTISPAPTETAAPSPSPSEVPTASPAPSITYTPTSLEEKLRNMEPTDSPTESPAPSPSPTEVPTQIPSPEPSPFPSEIPTSLPSQVPSTMPSRVPSATPSSKPSESMQPSTFPSLEPSISNSPSQRPSDIPSSQPSASIQPSSKPSLSTSPSALPSLFPSSVPSVTPSQLPTTSVNPSSVPTSAPSENPTNAPSVSPTISKGPSGSPSSVPSLVPSDLPSYVPSEGPSPAPSSPPSVSNMPSVVPSHNPSSLPTVSEVPSISPSLSPSTEPSSGPSISPSERPSLSISPSEEPSTFPSENPSEFPSSSPSDVPSSTPSSPPSSVPSDVPSSIPSTMPSATPSFSSKPSDSSAPTMSSPPSGMPSSSARPSTQPSSFPSMAPSTKPSFDPSTRPTSSMMPSHEPSNSPSVSTVPSSSPSLSPSESPSISPSEAPSTSPSILPSAAPSISASPTISNQPTISLVPSGMPSISVVPSSIPSTSLVPSTSPSMAPSTHPSFSTAPSASNAPSIQPSEFPSMVPSETPSIYPTPVSSMSPSSSSIPSELPSTLPSQSPSTTFSPSEYPSLTPTAAPSAGERRHIGLVSIVLQEVSGEMPSVTKDIFNTVALRFLRDTFPEVSLLSIDFLYVEVKNQTIGVSTNDRRLQEQETYIDLTVEFEVAADVFPGDPKGFNLEWAVRTFFEMNLDEFLARLKAANGFFQPTPVEGTNVVKIGGPSEEDSDRGIFTATILAALAGATIAMFAISTLIIRSGRNNEKSEDGVYAISDSYDSQESPSTIEGNRSEYSVAEGRSEQSTFGSLQKYRESNSQTASLEVADSQERQYNGHLRQIKETDTHSTASVGTDRYGPSEILEDITNLEVVISSVSAENQIERATVGTVSSSAVSTIGELATASSISRNTSLGVSEGESTTNVRTDHTRKVLDALDHLEAGEYFLSEGEVSTDVVNPRDTTGIHASMTGASSEVSCASMRLLKWLSTVEAVSEEPKRESVQIVGKYQGREDEQTALSTMASSTIANLDDDSTYVIPAPRTKRRGVSTLSKITETDGVPRSPAKKARTSLDLLRIGTGLEVGDSIAFKKCVTAPETIAFKKSSSPENAAAFKKCSTAPNRSDKPRANTFLATIDYTGAIKTTMARARTRSKGSTRGPVSIDIEAAEVIPVLSSPHWNDWDCSAVIDTPRSEREEMGAESVTITSSLSPKTRDAEILIDEGGGATSSKAGVFSREWPKNPFKKIAPEATASQQSIDEKGQPLKRKIASLFKFSRSAGRNGMDPRGCTEQDILQTHQESMVPDVDSVASPSKKSRGQDFAGLHANSPQWVTWGTDNMIGYFELEKNENIDSNDGGCGSHVLSENESVLDSHISESLAHRQAVIGSSPKKGDPDGKVTGDRYESWRSRIQSRRFQTKLNTSHVAAAGPPKAIDPPNGAAMDPPATEARSSASFIPRVSNPPVMFRPTGAASPLGKKLMELKVAKNSKATIKGSEEDGNLELEWDGHSMSLASQA